MHRLPDWLAIGAASIFILLAAYRIELPGLYYDELVFVNAAQGAPDNTFIHVRLGSVPLFIMPYLGALKAWIYAPVFHLFGVSALTIRLPAILLAAVTLVLLYWAMRRTIGGIWAAIAVWIMAVDPTNVFPSRLDWGPTVLMHFFQAAIIALWFSYRGKPELWKPALIFVCFGLGFFDKFNFIWLASAFVIGISLCYPDSLKNLWISSPRFARWMTIILVLVASGAALFFILPVLHLQPAKLPSMSLQTRWHGLLSTLAGVAVAHLIFENSSGMISFVPSWLILTDCALVLVCLFSPVKDAEARENRRNGLFFLLMGFLVFVQIVVTPQAGGPHHYSMILPLPLLAFVFLAQSLCRQIAAKNLRRLAAFLLLSAAVSVFVVSVHNVGEYLSRFRTISHYNPRWSPEIYSLSHYINEHGLEAQGVISVDWGLHNQLHALAPRKLQPRMHDYWPTFQNLGKENQEEQTTNLKFIFPEGKSLAVTFAASKETFPETRQNLLAALAGHQELKSRLLKEFWYGGEKIYEVYEIDRSPPSTGIHNAVVLNSRIELRKEAVIDLYSEQAHFELLDEPRMTADFQVNGSLLQSRSKCSSARSRL
jgi:4-amino-4-deoxy-L-arabinose transferase-like glycosyltransferase